MIIKTTPINNMNDAFSVKGMNVIVTGGNRGIGRGITEAFAQSGANVAILCRNEESAKRAIAEISVYGGDPFFQLCDIGSLESVNSAVEATYQRFGHIDVLVNNAGVSTKGAFIEMDDKISEWRRVVDTDLNGTAQITYAVAKHMAIEGKGGSIINISSVGGTTAGTSADHPKASYHSAKAGIDHLTRALAIELGDYAIRVNSVGPGPTHSELDKDLPQSALERVETRMPMHRFGEPIEVGALCVFLASPAAVHITGSVIMHDGGYLQII